MTKAERKKAYDEAQRDRAYLQAIWEKLFCLEVSEDPDAEEWEFLGDYLERGIVRANGDMKRLSNTEQVVWPEQKVAAGES